MTNSAEKRALGILLTNLGTPDAPTAPALRRYLREFLSDPRVVEVPRTLWWPVLNGIILRTRPRRSAEAYAQIWSEETGSPLLFHSKRQAQALQARLDDEAPGRVHVALGMRYGNPSLSRALEQLDAVGVRRLLVLPLYPQYSGTTTGSTFEAVGRLLSRRRDWPEVRLVRDYHDDAGYLDALADSVRRHWDQHGAADKLVLSFHGIPRSYGERGDPYQQECERTAELLAARLDLQPDQWLMTFQSRFGPQAWLKPYTDKTLAALPREGVKKVDLICPGFSADCLETLEENAIRNRDVFLEAGGEHFRYVPCLNDESAHIDALARLTFRHLQGW